MFEREGCQVEFAISGEEAVRLLCSSQPHEFDLVVMDYHLNGITGAQAVAQLRAHEKNRAARTPVVAATATLNGEEQRECIAAGVDDCLPKPFDPQNLRRVLAQVAIWRNRRS